jgi:hypothetical protein
MFLQYLSPMLIFLSLMLISIRWPRVGSGLHFFIRDLPGVFFIHALLRRGCPRHHRTNGAVAALKA